MANVSAREEPQVQEQTKIVAELFPQNITLYQVLLKMNYFYLV